jgi:hypothetical protein
MNVSASPRKTRTSIDVRSAASDDRKYSRVIHQSRP